MGKVSRRVSFVEKLSLSLGGSFIRGSTVHICNRSLLPHNRLVINLLSTDSPSLHTLLRAQIFNLFFSDNQVRSIVTESNRYAAQEIGSGEKQWSTTTEEICAYFGFMILMGVNQLPKIRDYWSTNPMLHYAPIANRISRDRFEEITRFLHFVDNSTLPARGHPSYSRLQKVAPVVRKLAEDFIYCQCR